MYPSLGTSVLKAVKSVETLKNIYNEINKTKTIFVLFYTCISYFYFIIKKHEKFKIRT